MVRSDCIVYERDIEEVSVTNSFKEEEFGRGIVRLAGKLIA